RPLNIQHPCWNGIARLLGIRSRSCVRENCVTRGCDLSKESGVPADTAAELSGAIGSVRAHFYDRPSTKDLSRIPTPCRQLLRISPRNQHGCCNAGTILLSKLPAMAQGLRHGP